MVIYSLLSETVLYSSKKKKKNRREKKVEETHQSSIVVFENVSITYCLCYLKKKNQRSKSHGIKVIYIYRS